MLAKIEIKEKQTANEKKSEVPSRKLSKLLRLPKFYADIKLSFILFAKKFLMVPSIYFSQIAKNKFLSKEIIEPNNDGSQSVHQKLQ